MRPVQLSVFLERFLFFVCLLELMKSLVVIAVAALLCVVCKGQSTYVPKKLPCAFRVDIERKVSAFDTRKSYLEVSGTLTKYHDEYTRTTQFFRPYDDDKGYYHVDFKQETSSRSTCNCGGKSNAQRNDLVSRVLYYQNQEYSYSVKVDDVDFHGISCTQYKARNVNAYADKDGYLVGVVPVSGTGSFDSEYYSFTWRAPVEDFADTKKEFSCGEACNQELRSVPKHTGPCPKSESEAGSDGSNCLMVPTVLLLFSLVLIILL